MKQKSDRSGRRDPRRAVIVAVVCLCLLAAAGFHKLSQVTLAKSDLNNLRQQRAAMGMPSPEQMRSRMLDNMAANLGLTESQKSRLRDALEEGPDPRSVFGDPSLSREQRFERMRQLGQARDERMRSILTPEQQIKFNEMQEQMRARFRGMRGPAGPGRGPTGQGAPRGSGSDMARPAGFGQFGSTSLSA